MDFFGCSWQAILLSWCLGINAAVVTFPLVVTARSPDDNPLLVEKIADPLIPIGYGKRELTSFEKYRLNRAIAELDKSAKAQLEQGNIEQAMELWYRQLKLARAVGKASEIKALGEVGDIVWEKNRSDDLRNIADRLTAIQTQAASEEALTDSLLNQLAVAYQQVRYLDKAIDIYQQIVASNKQANKPTVKDKDLRQLGQLYLSIFDYKNAADIYQELLDNRTNKNQQILDLKTLIGIYENSQQIERSIQVRKRLTEQYYQKQNLKPIPAWEIAIAQDYETLDRYHLAIEAYRSALDTATATQQLALAGKALQGIAHLYQQQEKTDLAIATYDQLIDIQQQSNNYYGLIDTYDILGQIYLESDRKKQALQYFQQGLQLAISLDYKVKYFNNLVEQFSAE